MSLGKTTCFVVSCSDCPLADFVDMSKVFCSQFVAQHSYLAARLGKSMKFNSCFDFKLHVLLSSVKTYAAWLIVINGKKEKGQECIYRVVHKERMFLKWVVVGRVSFFGVTSNQKSTFENLVRVDDLKVSIREEIATVPQEMLVNVMQNFEERLRKCVWQEGRHLSDIIFRK